MINNSPKVPYHIVEQTTHNGIMRCCNLFPTYFADIDAMTEYLPYLKELGINVVWINPIQLSGDTPLKKFDSITGLNQDVSKSVYAISDQYMIDPRFSVVKRDEMNNPVWTPSQKERLEKENLIEITSATKDSISFTSSESSEDFEYDERKCIQLLDKEAIVRFTQKAKDLKITPIFDLVLNHVSKDALIVKKRPEWFSEDNTYLDAKAFIYADLLGGKEISEERRENILEKIEEIKFEFWDDIITYYIEELGFCGARVDCIRKVPAEVREPIYQQIKDYIPEDCPVPLVILEEALFSDLNAKQFKEIVKGAGATHITGSVYCRERTWTGGLEDNIYQSWPSDRQNDSAYNYEDKHKHDMVSQGVINFTGNHDHYSCAMKVCRELAYERLIENKPLFEQYNKLKKDNDSTQEARKSVFIHHYVNEIMHELHHPDKHEKTVNRFGKYYRDKLLTNMLAGSGGYYMMPGDEVASFKQPSVFLRDQGTLLYPETAYKETETEKGNECIHNMALKKIQQSGYKNEYALLDVENKNKLLSAWVEQIKNEIHADVYKSKTEFMQIMQVKQLTEMPNVVQNDKNNWGSPKSLGKFANKDFFNEINHILAFLPASKKGFWSETCKVINANIFVAIRRNGQNYEGETDVVIVNTNPDKTYEIDKEDMHKIGMWLQERLFPGSSNKYNEYCGNPEYQKTYGTILGNEEHGIRPANLYFAGKLTLGDGLQQHAVQVNGEPQGFVIKVAPKPLHNNLLQTISEPLSPEKTKESPLIELAKKSPVKKKFPESPRTQQVHRMQSLSLNDENQSPINNNKKYASKTKLNFDDVSNSFSDIFSSGPFIVSQFNYETKEKSKVEWFEENIEENAEQKTRYSFI